MTHLFQETDWFSVTTTPAYIGAYKTRHRGMDGKIYEGYSWFNSKTWGYTRDTPQSAFYVAATRSSQQSKEWKGIYEQPKS